MKYIKRYRIFESESLEQLPTFNNKELDDMMQDLKYILLDLHDEGWVVNLSYDPKRYQQIVSYGKDTITVTIQKKSPSTRYSPTYPLDSEFVLADVSEYTLRILEYFDNLKHEIKTCKNENSDTPTNVEFLSAGNLGYIHGGWYTMHYRYQNNNVDLESKEKVLAVDIKIFLEKEDWDLDESTF